MQHFATHLRPSQQTTHSQRAGGYKNTIKRKRDEDSDEPSDGPGNDAKGLPTASNAQSYTPSAAKIAHRHVAGLVPDDGASIPPPPFPHSTARTSNDHLSYAKVQQEIAGLNPAVYAANATSKSHAVGGTNEKPALRKTHLDVLSTVLHRCLLEGDYDRAARAWGMILRTQLAGQPIDPRNHGRWGIGAEILLRQSPRNQLSHLQNGHSHREENRLFTAEGFELVRDYYERFVVQYPNRKTAPYAIDSRTFYPPLFSIWITSVLEKSKRARKEYDEERQHIRSASGTSEDYKTLSPEDARVREVAIVDEELEHANEIRERLDQLVVSPPFDKHAQLLLLRGNVGLWISDLILADRQPRQQDDDNDWDMDVSEDNHSTTESAAEKLRKYTDSLQELRRAQDFFSSAETNGSGSAGPAMSSIDTKIRYLTRQMARLGK
jgi:hypothetical protein